MDRFYVNPVPPSGSERRFPSEQPTAGRRSPPASATFVFSFLPARGAALEDPPHNGLGNAEPPAVPRWQRGSHRQAHTASPAPPAAPLPTHRATPHSGRLNGRASAAAGGPAAPASPPRAGAAPASPPSAAGGGPEPAQRGGTGVPRLAAPARAPLCLLSALGAPARSCSSETATGSGAGQPPPCLCLHRQCME